jgi:putative flippase GtrA
MAPFLNVIRSNDSLRSAARFLAVGALGTLVDLGLFTALNLLMGVPALLANTVSYSAGIVNNYLLHRAWTYSSRPKQAASGQFARFAMVSLSALALNNLLVLILTPLFSEFVFLPGGAALLAKLCAIGVGMVWNFLMNHFWVFRARQS